jgi:hypothetical protein
MTKSCTKVLALVLMGAGVHAAALGAQEKPAGKETVILDTSGFWRFYLAMRTPVVRDGESLKEIGAACNTPAPASGWTEVEFDDSGWVRLAGAPLASWCNWDPAVRANVGFVYCHGSSLAQAQLCLRIVLSAVGGAGGRCRATQREATCRRAGMELKLAGVGHGPRLGRPP